MKTFKHLKAAINIQGAPKLNVCFHRASALVLDVPGSELCIGTFRAATEEERVTNPNALTEPFIHAWVEHRGVVFAPTTIEANDMKLMPIDKDYYYETNGAHDIKRITRKQLITLSGEIGLSQHLLHNKPTRNSVSVGGELMKAAGVQWRDNESGGVIPA